MALGYYKLGQANNVRRAEKHEKRLARIALMPMLQVRGGRVRTHLLHALVISPLNTRPLRDGAIGEGSKTLLHDNGLGVYGSVWKMSCAFDVHFKQKLQ